MSTTPGIAFILVAMLGVLSRGAPAIMPGGDPAAWPHVKPILQKISAKAPDGTPCCEWIGPDGAGHFVKMVHNGIEYGMMQALAEGFAVMKAADFRLDLLKIATCTITGA
jgi:6-phosphogluconate dehydrogenase